MGVAHSRTIYDPQNRRLYLQAHATRYGTKISDWEIDEKKRMVCKEYVDIMFNKPDFKTLYQEFQKLGLKGINQVFNTKTGKFDEEIYDFNVKY